ncbi:MAG: HlyD family efflux transporter periplasmic adaptor subunit, partial [Patescibacteria group bacterium]
MPTFLFNFFPMLRHAYKTTKRYAFAHKVISTVIVVIVLGGGWYAWGKATTASAQTRYILGTASTSTIISTVSASGQIAAENQIDVKAKATGDITWVGVKAGSKVRAGQALAGIDSGDAQQAYQDAKKSLAAAELQYQKDSAQAPISYQKDQDALTQAQNDLADDYNSLYSDLSNVYLDLPNSTTVANNTLYGYDLDPQKSTWNMDYMINIFSTQNTTSVKSSQTRAVNDYTTARAAYDTAAAAFKTIGRSSDPATLETIMQQSIDTATAVAQALQSELNFLGAVSDLAQSYNIKLPSAFATLQSSARSQLSSANGDLSTLLADKKTITNAKITITTDKQNVQLDQVGNDSGDNPISLQIELNNLEKQRQDLATQAADLADYTVVAPFAGTVASVAAQVGNPAGDIATLITNQQLATLSLNEVDAAKVTLGNKATLTYDAIDGLTQTGTVAEIDPAGTVSQGVVSYMIKISLDTQDSRVKTGMTVNASIQTAVHQDVIAVPQTAIKTSGSQSYVLVFSPPISQEEIQAAGAQGVLPVQAPMQMPVTTGISDDTSTEILSGLDAGHQIVVRTTTSAATATTKATPSTTGARGGFGGGGNATFIQRG